MRKVKAIGEQKDAVELVREIDKLNLTRYISEIVASLLETKLAKASDVTKCVQIAARMHQLYADFTPKLVAGLTAVLAPKAKNDKGEDIEPQQARAVLRLLTELVMVGVLVDPVTVTNHIRRLFTDNAEGDAEHLTLQVS
jgi:hypothetical protein